MVTSEQSPGGEGVRLPAPGDKQSGGGGPSGEVEEGERGREKSRGKPGVVPRAAPSSGAAWLGPEGRRRQQGGGQQPAEWRRDDWKEAGGGGQGAPGTTGRGRPLGGGGTVALRLVEGNSPSFSPRGGKAGLSAYTVGFLPTLPCEEKDSCHHPRHAAVKLTPAEASCPKLLSYLLTEPGLKNTLPESCGVAQMTQG